MSETKTKRQLSEKEVRDLLGESVRASLDLENHMKLYSYRIINPEVFIRSVGETCNEVAKVFNLITDNGEADFSFTPSSIGEKNEGGKTSS